MGNIASDVFVLVMIAVISVVLLAGCGGDKCVNVEGPCTYETSDSRDFSEVWSEDNDWKETNVKDSYNSDTVHEANDNTYTD